MTIANATPHDTYEGLRRQFMALRTLAASNEAIASNLSKQLRDQTQTLADLDAERNTNAQLTAALELAERQRDQLKAENEALRRNADRYLVLRQADVDNIQNGGLFAGLTPDNIVINGHHLDERTDAVIAARKEVAP